MRVVTETLSRACWQARLEVEESGCSSHDWPGEGLRGVRTDAEARAYGASADAVWVWVPSQVWILPVSDVVGLTGSSAQPPAALIPGSARRRVAVLRATCHHLCTCGLRLRTTALLPRRAPPHCRDVRLDEAVRLVVCWDHMLLTGRTEGVWAYAAAAGRCRPALILFCVELHVRVPAALCNSQLANIQSVNASHTAPWSVSSSSSLARLRHRSRTVLCRPVPNLGLWVARNPLFSTKYALNSAFP